MFTVAFGSLLGYIGANALANNQQYGTIGGSIVIGIAGLILSMIPNAEGFGMGIATMGFAKALYHQVGGQL